MGAIGRQREPSRTYLLEPEHLVGRGPQCSLRIPEHYVSTQHAVVRWNGQLWEVVDRGSLNGTLLDGAALQPGRPYPLVVGSRLVFGHGDEAWTVEDVSPPEVMLIDVDTGRALLASDGVVGVPSGEEPLATVYRGIDGTWRLEKSDGDPLVLTQGVVFAVGSHSFRFCCPDAVATTASAGGVESGGPAVATFRVSSDEEFVEFFLEYPRRRMSLGARSHNYLLLILARSRMADRDSGLAESSCGWTYKEILADALRMTPQQIDGEVFRVRKHFAQHGLHEAASVIERRPRTKQIRFGLDKIKIERI